jgi:hypothetical protein
LTPSTASTPPRRAGRARRWILRTLLALFVLLLAWLLAGIPLFVLPPASQPDKADVIYVIGPPNPTRRDLAVGGRARGLQRRVPLRRHVRHPVAVHDAG